MLEKSIRDERFTVTLTKKEKELIQSRADKMGITMSAFARYVLKDFCERSGS